MLDLNDLLQHRFLRIMSPRVPKTTNTKNILLRNKINAAAKSFEKIIKGVMRNKNRPKTV